MGEQQTDTRNYVLWHRSDRGDAWKPIAEASTRDELIKVMDGGPPGEYLDLRKDERP
jgi:hypothetical protein